TSFPINGAKWWMWVGTSARTTVYTIQPTRSHEEALALWGGYTGGLTRDGYAAYNWVTTAEHQMDLVHVNRWLQKVEVKHHIEPRGFLRAKRPRFLRAGRPPKESLTFAKGVRARLASEVRWTKRYREASQKARERRYRRAVRSMGRFLAHPWKDPDAKRIAKETGDRLGILYTFVRDPRVSWNSNGAEREVRAGAVYRKISGGRRTVDGGRVLVRILTVSRTCRKRGLGFWEVVKRKLLAYHAGPGPPWARPSS
ncbi:transposase IS66, partial [mine drainage metagenome]